MPFELSFDAPLAGNAAIPGDERLTLLLMAFAMRPDTAVSIANPSPAPSVEAFKAFLEARGARFDAEPGGFTMIGSEWPPDLVIGADVPDAVLHILLPRAMKTGRVRVTESASRPRLVDRLMTVLVPFGIERGMVSEDGGYIILEQAVFDVPRTTVPAHSDWELEAVLIVAEGLPQGTMVSYPAAVSSHSLKLAAMVGCVCETGPDSREARLNRRLAKAAGDTPPVVARFVWMPPSPVRVEVPGDTTIAAALTCAALVLPKSRLTIGHVLWEQGRRGFWDAARRMKGRIETNIRGGSFDAADVTVRHGELTGIHLSQAQALTMRPELLLLGALTPAATGESVVNDATDAPGMGRERFMMLARGLERLGCHVGNYTDGIVLEGGQPMRGNALESGGDPTVALALAVSALNAAGTTVIDDIEDDIWPAGSFRDILRQCAGALSA